MADKQEKPLPGCKAILLCERTRVEAQSGRISLLGIINQLKFSAFPNRTKPMKLFLHLVDGIGAYSITVELHDLAEDRIIAKSKSAILAFPERLLSIRRFLPLPALSIPHPGRYDVMVFANGMELDRQQRIASLENEGGTL